MTWHGHHHSYQRTCPVDAQRCGGRNGSLLPMSEFCLLKQSVRAISRRSAPCFLWISHGSNICTSPAPHVRLLTLTLLASLCAADGSTPLPVHVVIGNAGAELCWNVAPKTPNHFEVLFGTAVRNMSEVPPLHVWNTTSKQTVHCQAH